VRVELKERGTKVENIGKIGGVSAIYLKSSFSHPIFLSY
jgi:hypothetical protein